MQVAEHVLNDPTFVKLYNYAQSCIYVSYSCELCTIID